MLELSSTNVHIELVRQLPVEGLQEGLESRHDADDASHP